ncbi:MAG: O-methyltransferase [Saprospiraceae bacterium]|nr:O-methyltransferase [Saprospiraceae bacterium]
MLEGLSLDILRYCDTHLSSVPDYLTELERKTHLQTMLPQMLSGAVQGRFLSLLSRLKKPDTIVEIGTFTGYSAMCLAEGLSPMGRLYTFEVDDSYDEIIKRLQENLVLCNKIDFIKGSALKLLPTKNWKVDLAFVDGSKKEYLDYLKVLEPMMPSGSVLISDNVLWYGKVVQENKDKDTLIIDQYNQYLRNSENWDVVILPIRDGISVAIKK